MINPPPEPVNVARGTIVGITTTLVSALVMGINATGGLTMMEWAAYDFFLRHRRPELPSERITIVEINEADIQKYHWPMNDDVLAQALENLIKYQPRVIGVDIYRDLPVEPGHARLQKVYGSTNNLFFIKKLLGEQIQGPGMLEERGQVVTADVPKDQDGKVRRGFLSLVDPSNDNQVIFSLGAQMALTYLAQENITLQPLDESRSYYQLGQGVYRPLMPQDGAYVKEEMGGYQVLINYSNPQPNRHRNIKNFTSVTFDQVVQGQVEPSLIRDRIILVGYASPGVGDILYTPMSVNDQTAVYGVEVHGNLAHQMIENALAGRNNIKAIPDGWEYAFLFGWTILGSSFAGQFVRDRARAIGGIALVQGSLIGSYYLIFVQWGYWIPLGAPFLAVTSSSVLTITALLWFKLKLSYRQLATYAQTLELRVDERTKDLENSRREILQQERFLRMVIENIPQQIFWKDQHLRLLGSNRHWADTMAQESSTEDQGLEEREGAPPWVDPITAHQEQEILAHNQPVMHQEKKVERNGQVQWLNESKLPIQDPHGQVVGLLGVVDDVTIYKEAQAAMAIAKRKAEEASQAKSTFIANMSHELRTPLNAIIGFSKIMGRDRHLSPDNLKNLKIINQSGEYLLTLINNILDLSKIEAGKTTFNPQDFDLYSLLDEVENLLKLKADEKNLHFVIQREARVQRYLHTDGVKLRQVLINLANNAIKFTHAGGVLVRVMAESAPTLEDKQVTIHFAIEDTGEGIAPEELGSIFTSFSQSASGRNAQEGTGLGLSISRKFIHLMGGDITVESEVGVGTTFKFWITVKVAGAMATDREQIKPLTIVGLTPGQPIYKLMVVDDKAVNCALVTQLLEPMGFAIKSASNGQEAIALGQTWQPALIWMDMKMPVMDGYEATKIIKQLNPAIVIIALTASILEEEKEDIFAVGCDAIINKPFQESEIFDALAKYLGVSYVYEEPPASSSPAEFAPTPLDPNALTILAPSIRQQLYDYAIAGSDDEILALLKTLGPEHSPMVAHLSRMADRFQFEQIIALLEAVTP